MTEAAELPAWQHGYDLADLREIAQIFAAHDDGLILGAFSAFKENNAAEALAGGRLFREGQAVADFEQVARSRPLKDFTGAPRAAARPGDGMVRRFAYEPGREEEAADLIAAMADGLPGCWAFAWQEHPGDRAIMDSLGFELAAVKIKASSELTGIYWRGAPEGLLGEKPWQPLPRRDELGLVQLADGLEVGPLLQAANALSLSYEDHYSSYNVRHTWSALALRGYGGDVNFIIKPAEMAKKWKAEHPEELGWQLADTPLRVALPEAEPLISALPGKPHRVRLMRLAPGGGELKRHADITDPDAGTELGQLCRLHFPLASNEGCVFESWGLGGERKAAHMEPGSCWYLDTRKPHTARNGGESERLHLVVDMEVDAGLEAALDKVEP